MFSSEKEVLMRQIRRLLFLVLLSLSGCAPSSSDTQTAVAVAPFPAYPNIVQGTGSQTWLSETTTLATLRTTFETEDSPAVIRAWYEALLRQQGWSEWQVEGLRRDEGHFIVTDYTVCPGKNLQLKLEAHMGVTRVTLEHRLLRCSPTTTP
jgi:hypothetical protein